MNRQQKLETIWKNTHTDYKGTYGDTGKRTILVNENGRTCLAFLDDLTDEEINDKLTFIKKCSLKWGAK